MLSLSALHRLRAEFKNWNHVLSAISEDREIRDMNSYLIQDTICLREFEKPIVIQLRNRYDYILLLREA